jgi:hypothetical protein
VQNIGFNNYGKLSQLWPSNAEGLLRCLGPENTMLPASVREEDLKKVVDFNE